MPRRLSDPEWLQFQHDVDVESLPLAPWGAVIQWGQQFILVYVCQRDGFLCRAGEVMLSDISDRPDLIKNVSGTYDYKEGIWLYHLPEELMNLTVEVAKDSLVATGKIIKEVAETAGGAAGALTGPLLENLAIPLIVLAIIYLGIGRGR